MADQQTCGENDCLLSYGDDGLAIFAPAGTPFTPGVRLTGTEAAQLSNPI